MDNEMDFVPNDNPNEERLYLYQEAIKKLDSFIRIIYTIMSYDSVSESDKYDLETMTDISNTMEIQLLEILKNHNGNIEFINDCYNNEEY